MNPSIRIKNWVTSFGVVLIPLLNTPSLGQEFDPNTGELITSLPDTITQVVEETPLQYDPLTGNPIHSPKNKDNSMIDSSIQDQVPSQVLTSDLNLATQPAPFPMNPVKDMDICTKATLDAVAETSDLWYLGSIYLVGVPAILIWPVKVPEKNLWNLDPESARQYAQCYEEALRNERQRRLTMSCASCAGIYGALLFFVF